MNIFINRNPVDGPWGGGNLFVRSVFETLPSLGFKIVTNPFHDIPDIIMLQSPKSSSDCNFSINEAIFLKNKNPHIQIVLRVNDCDARKATTGVDRVWIESSAYVDKTIFVSKWMKDYFVKKGWQCKDNHVLYNGVNLEHFRPRQKINNGKTNIVTHHWSNNRMKGFDVYEKLDKYVGDNHKKYTFTYIGRELGTFKNTIVIPPLFGASLGEQLSKYDVYVSASKFDPAPNHIIESLATNLPTLACKDGGGSVELCGGRNIFSSFENLIKILESKEYKTNDTSRIYTWEKCMKNLEIILKRPL